MIGHRSKSRPHDEYFIDMQGFHSHGKSWKKVVMESYGKVMENSKNPEFHGNLFARKKSHGKVMEFCF